MAARQGFVAHIVAAYGDLRGSMRREIERAPREENLLALVMFGCFIVFLSFLPKLFATDLHANPDQSIAAGVIMWFFVVMFFLPLVLYGIAALSHLLARAFGASGPYFKARHALFWALAVLSPVLITKAMIASAVAQIGGAYAPWILGALNLLLLLAILRIWGAMLAEAEGFRSSARVSGVIALVLGALYGLIYLLTLIGQG